MGTMQTQLSKFKESASDVHALRADVKCISKILERKVVIFTLKSFPFSRLFTEEKKTN